MPTPDLSALRQQFDVLAREALLPAPPAGLAEQLRALAAELDQASADAPSADYARALLDRARDARALAERLDLRAR